MPHFILPLLSGIGVVAACVGLLGVLRHLRGAARAETIDPPPSLVRVLTSDADLREAVARAVAFDQAAIEALHSRALRYEAMVPIASVTDIAARRARGLLAEAPGDDAPHSA